MTDCTDKKKNSQVMNQMIQSLNMVLYGDVAAYNHCIQLLATLEQQLQDSLNANDRLEYKVIQLEDVDRKLTESLKSVAEATLEFRRANEKLKKPIDTIGKQLVMVNTGRSGSVSLNMVGYGHRQDERTRMQFGLAADSLSKLSMPMWKREGPGKLALELARIRSQVLQKNEECTTRKGIDGLAADYRVATRCLGQSPSNVLLASLQLVNWLRDFEGYFEETKNEAPEDQWMNYL